MLMLTRGCPILGELKHEHHQTPTWQGQRERVTVWRQAAAIS